LGSSAQTARQAQQEFAAKEAALNAKLEVMQRNLQALTGVQPPQNPEVDQVKKQFGSLYPNLSKMEEQYERYEQLLAKIESLEEQNNHYWGSHASNTVDSLYSVAEESLKTPLSPEARHQLYASFVGYIQANPELEERYKTDAKGLVKDFWKAFSASFIDPYRRADAVAAANRVPAGLPQDTPGGAPQATPAPQFKSLDERAKAAWSTYKLGRPSNS
jgi:chromosome segregation ATPase